MKYTIEMKKCYLLVTFDPEKEQKLADKVDKELEKIGLMQQESREVKGGLVEYEYIDNCDDGQGSLNLEEWLECLQSYGVHIGISCYGKNWEVTFNTYDSTTVEDKDVMKAMTKAFKQWQKEGRVTYSLKKGHEDEATSLKDLLDDLIGS